MKDLTVIVKPVGSGCNLACVYCYNNPERDFSHIPHMDEKLFKSLVQQLSVLPLRHLQFMWHGGEPLLAGRDFYEQAIEMQHLLLPKTMKVKNTLQTNGTLITPEWVELFMHCDISIGISIDGPKHVHDANRKDLGGNGTFDRVYRGVKLLQNAGVRFGANAVITKASLPYPLEIYDFYKQEGLFPCDFSPCAEFDQETGLPFPFSITPQEYFEFMSTIFGAWLKDDNPEYNIRRFGEYIQAGIGGRQRLCIFQHGCHRYLAIEQDGNAFVCGRFAGSDATYVGNITEQTVDEILSSERYRSVVMAMNADRPECNDCKWQEHCKGGCTYYRYFHTGSFDGPNYFCEAHKAMFAHVEEMVKPIKESLSMEK